MTECNGSHPEGWPHVFCKPITAEQARRIAADWWRRQEKGTEGAWRELGAHTWSTGRDS